MTSDYTQNPKKQIGFTDKEISHLNDFVDLEKKISSEGHNKKTYTVMEIREILGISKGKAYSLCSEGHFRIIRIGRAIRISKSSFDEWLDEKMK